MSFSSKQLALAIGLVATVPGVTFASEESYDLGLFTASFSLALASYSFLIVLGLLLIAIVLRRPSEQVKRLLFAAVVAIVTSATVVLAGSTIYLNTISWSKGPVHWHADFEVWACGRELDLIDPQGFLSNKTGTTTRHEHNDKRLHFEGVVLNEDDATLTSFFSALGVTLTNELLLFPTNERVERFAAGDTCPDGSIGYVQVFAFRTLNDYYYQAKVDPKTYRFTPKSQVPPGDCLIIEFGPVAERTERLCRSFQVAEEIGKLRGELYGHSD